MPVFSLFCVKQQSGTKTKSSNYAEYDYFTEHTGWHKISTFERCNLSQKPILSVKNPLNLFFVLTFLFLSLSYCIHYEQSHLLNGNNKQTRAL